MRPLTVVSLLTLTLATSGCGQAGNPEQQAASLKEQAAGMAALNPPPRASDRPLGVDIEACDFGTPLGAHEKEGETYYCGVFTVPQDWEEPDGARIDLRFVVARATRESPEPDPLVFLAGGPGQSAIASALSAYDAVRPTRDIVRLDQRGTGRSQRLGLEECLVLALQDESAGEDVELLLSAMAAAERDDVNASTSEAAASRKAIKETVDRLCWNQFTAQGLNLNVFTTAQSARDVVELLKALDYTAFNLHGTSYGTRLAMTIMRELVGIDEAPELRAVVLDSPFPPSMHLLTTTPHNYHDPVIRIFSECRSDPVCANAYPDLQARFVALLERLETNPIESDGETIGPRELLRTIADLRGTRAGYIPRMIAELETGNPSTYLALERRELGMESAEAVGGLDADDPVQVYIAEVMSVLGSGGEITAGIQFIAGFSKAMQEEEPLRALERFIRDGYAGDVQDRLLVLTRDLDPADIDDSTMVAELRAGAEAATPQGPEEQAAAKARADRLLAIIEIAQFLNKNIHCAEDLHFATLDQALAVVEGLEIPQLADRGDLVEQAARCDAWPVKPQPSSVTAPVRSDIPTLILQGAYDVKTPVIMGQEAARQLSRSTLAIVPQQGHEVWVNATNCPAKLATAFIIDPTRRLDLSCLETRKPRWALPEGT